MEKNFVVIILVLLIIIFMLRFLPALFVGPKTADVEWNAINPAKQKEQHKKIIDQSKSDYKDFMDKQRSLR